MAFLDNSGDIILDAVLTDAGRKRLARADGTFKIAKFALGDDEIDYTLYDKNNASGSAYYDLSLLQTPILEAFTNNTSILKSRLISIPQTNLLYLPTMKLNDTAGANNLDGQSGPSKIALSTAANGFDDGGVIYVSVDPPNLGTGVSNPNSVNENTAPFKTSAGNTTVLFGSATETDGAQIRIDQGQDTTAIPPLQKLDTTLTETQYIIEIDNRLGNIVNPEDQISKAAISFIDDDNIASYYFSLANDTAFVKQINDFTVDNSKNVIAGPRGTALKFLIGASVDLQQSTYLFELLGGTDSYPLKGGGNGTFYYIDTIVRVTGAQTGTSLDLPIRFLKFKSNP